MGENTEQERKDSSLSLVLICTFDKKSPQIAVMVVGVQSGDMGSWAGEMSSCMREK